MSYQTCPLCKGTGMSHEVVTYNVGESCSVCKGKKIINTLTGKPPKN